MVRAIILDPLHKPNTGPSHRVGQASKIHLLTNNNYFDSVAYSFNGTGGMEQNISLFVTTATLSDADLNVIVASRVGKEDFVVEGSFETGITESVSE